MAAILSTEHSLHSQVSHCTHPSCPTLVTKQYSSKGLGIYLGDLKTFQVKPMWGESPGVDMINLLVSEPMFRIDCVCVYEERYVFPIYSLQTCFGTWPQQEAENKGTNQN